MTAGNRAVARASFSSVADISLDGAFRPAVTSDDTRLNRPRPIDLGTVSGALQGLARSVESYRGYECPSVTYAQQHCSEQRRRGTAS